MRTIQYRGFNISNFALGTVQFGIHYGITNHEGQTPADEVKKIIDFILKNGINCFDTAISYGNSEKILGSTLPISNNLLIISKISTTDFHKIDQKVNESLTNLNKTSLFGLLLHDSKLLSRWTNQESDIIKKLKFNNKINFFGASIYTNNEFDLALTNDSIDIIQIPFNIFDQRALHLRWIEKAKNKHKLIIIRSVFLQGLLLMESSTVPAYLEEAKEYIVKLEKICNKHAINKQTLALEFIKYFTQECVVLFGCENLAQASDNISIFNNKFTMDQKLLKNLLFEFHSIGENIINPTKWNTNK